MKLYKLTAEGRELVAANGRQLPPHVIKPDLKQALGFYQGAGLDIDPSHLTWRIGKQAVR